MTTLCRPLDCAPACGNLFREAKDLLGATQEKSSVRSAMFIGRNCKQFSSSVGAAQGWPCRSLSERGPGTQGFLTRWKNAHAAIGARNLFRFILRRFEIVNSLRACFKISRGRYLRSSGLKSAPRRVCHDFWLFDQPRIKPNQGKSR